jgi:Na+/phosphate symporter
MEETREPKVGITTPLKPSYPSNPLELPVAKPATASQERVRYDWWERIKVGKLLLFLGSLYLFILAITLMKDGARGLAPVLQHVFSMDHLANCLGFGWLFSYLIMSGSPVAAASLTFFDAGIIDQLGAYAMITGSRLGASFIVLFIGFLYVLRGRDRSTSLSMGLLSLVVTLTTYLPGFILGLFALQEDWLSGIQPRHGAILYSILDFAIAPVADIFLLLLPQWLIFFAGLGIVLISFNLFDKCLPQMTLKESQVGWMSRLVYRPIVMFLLGGLVTMISMSVSLSLSILVPLSTRGFVRRENVIPYIMGANITTFIDTLLAAVLLSNPAAFTLIFVGISSTTLVSLLILVAAYRHYRTAILRMVAWITADNRNLAIFMLSIFVLPVLFMLL